MTVTKQQDMEISLPEMQQDEGKRLILRGVAVWMGGIDTGWSTRRRDIASLCIFASVAERVGLNSMMEIEKNW